MSGGTRTEDYLRDMLEHAVKAQEFVRGMTFERFVDDDKTSYATMRALEIIGEAARKIPLDFRNAHSGIRWRAICGMRDRLIHDYKGIMHSVVWNTVHDDLPALKVQLRELLGEN